MVIVYKDTVLQDRYRIISHIGKGGMGSVYLARDENLGVTVAVKQNFFTEDRLIEAFKREARLLAGLRHPALPQVKDYFIDLAGQFLVMEYVPGDDLGAILEKRERETAPVGEAKPFDVDEVVHWAEQLLDVLDYLHMRPEPIIHRDIKPQNLKLAERNQIILLDFGLAKGKPLYMTRVTTTGSLHGYTPSYAPIEQIRGLGTDPRSDLYGLGATLYHLITGEPPVDAATRADAYLGGEPDPLHPANEINPKVPQGLSEVLMKVMAQHRNNRPASAAEMLDMLRTAKYSTVVDRQAREYEKRKQQEEQDRVAETARQKAETQRASEAETQKQLEEQRRIEAERRRQQEEQRRAEELARKKLEEEQERKAREEAERLRKQEEEERKAIEAERLKRQQEMLRKQQEQAAAQAMASTVVIEPSLEKQKEAARPARKKLFIAAAGLAIILTVLAAIILLNRSEKPAASSQSASGHANNTNSPGENTAARIVRLQPGTFRTPGKVYKVSLSNDGKVLASASDEKSVRLWQASGARELTGHSQRGRSVAVSRDGQTVASGSDDGMIRLWRVSDGELVSTLREHSRYVFNVGFSPDGQTLFSASGDKTIKLWRVSGGQVIKTVRIPEEGYFIGPVSPDLQLVGFYSEDRSFKLWSLTEDKLLRTLEGDVPLYSCGAFTNDGQMLALGSRDGKVQLWRVSDGQMVRAMKIDAPAASFGASAERQANVSSAAPGPIARCLAFSADGKTLAAGFENGAIKFWRVSDGNLIKTIEGRTGQGHTGAVNSLAFSADGRTLASGSEDQTIKIWNVAEN